MGKTAILAIRIIGDATDAVTALEKVDGSAKSMQGTMDKASVGAGLALGALAGVATIAGNAASDLQQATGAVDSVFGTYASKVHDYASTAATDVGLAKTEYENMAAVIGSQLKNMGVSMDDVSGQSNGLIGLGADLAATFGGTTSEAVSALSSLLRGERDPIERYGVSMNQAAIDAQKAAMGLSGLSGEADKNATLQATLALLTAQTADASGQFARESDSAAGMQQRANAAWTDAAAALGEQLLPVMTLAAEQLAGLAQWASENSGVVTGLAIGIGILAAAILVINGAMKVFAAVQAIQTAAQWASNAAWLASPITWIIIAIIAAIALVVAAVVLTIQYWDEIAAVGAQVWGSIIDWIQQVGQWFGSIFSAIGDWWNGLVGSWQRGINNFIGLIKLALDWLGKIINGAIPGWVKDMIGLGSKGISARMVVEEPAARSSLMAFTAAETMAGFSARSFAPQAFAASTPAPDLGRISTTATDTRPTVTNVYNVKVEGAIDPHGTARTIKDVLTRHGQSTGELTAAGQSWR